MSGANISFKLNKIKNVKIFYDAVIKGLNNNCQSFNLFIKDKEILPSVCAPIAGLIDYFKKTKGISFAIEFKNELSKAALSCINNPIKSELAPQQLFNDPFGKVLSFSTGTGTGIIVNSIVNNTRKIATVSKGVINGLEWSLNEAMDNVLRHSFTKEGFIMADLDNKKERILICVYDSGIGIFNSLTKSGQYNDIKTNIQAIALALSEEITRDKKSGQGNGLWGLSRIVEDNRGFLQIISNGGSYIRNSENKIRTEDSGFCFIDKEKGSTTVFYQLNLKNEINISKDINSNFVVDLELENLENDKGDIVIKKFPEGTGTRSAAERMRNYIINAITSGYKKIILDFSNVNIVSSSYADELFGNIINKYGISFFLEKISIVNLSPTNRTIVDRSISQRMAQSFSSDSKK